MEWSPKWHGKALERIQSDDFSQLFPLILHFAGECILIKIRLIIDNASLTKRFESNNLKTIHVQNIKPISADFFEDDFYFVDKYILAFFSTHVTTHP